jgi:orotate phosphoribosyltransferase
MLRKFQKQNLLLLAKNGGFQFTDKWFPYTSGWIGPYYVQSMDVCKTAIGFAGAIDGIVQTIEKIIRDSDQAIDIISGGESRDWPFAFPVAEKLGVAPVMIYKDGKMLGADVKGKIVIHVADLNNEGSSPRDMWVPAIRSAGGIITSIVFLVDRLEDGVEEMEKLGINSYAVIPLNQEAWKFLQKEGFINEDIYNSLMEYWQDREAWGVKKLTEHPEILSEIIKKDVKKGMKIYRKYWPLMGQSLVDLLDFEALQIGNQFLDQKKKNH